MKMQVLFMSMLFLAGLFLLGCDDTWELALSSFGNINATNSRADAASVISMGRDDDDGMAKKWHIGGGTGN